MQVSDLSDKAMNLLFSAHWPSTCIKPYKIHFQKRISSGLQKKVCKGENYAWDFSSYMTEEGLYEAKN